MRERIGNKRLQPDGSVFVFEVASIDETFAELKNKGVEFLHGEPAENEFSRYVALRDSFGSVHEVYESKVKK